MSQYRVAKTQISTSKLTSNTPATDHDDLDVLTKETRHLGLVVVRGPLLLTISPVDGMEEIENPFNVQE